MSILESLQKADKAWQAAKKVAEKEIKPGKSILDCAEKIEDEIKKHAGIAFPINLSRNNSAAHYSPLSDSKEIWGPEDVIKVDIGAQSNGYTVDGAFTIDLSKNNKRLVEASKNALEKALDYVKKNKKDSRVGEIGTIIEKEITSGGFKPISNLMGHEISAYNLHAGKSIPNISQKDNSTLGTNRIYAIEPFASTGNGFVKNTSFCSIYFQADKQTRNTIGRQILKEAEEFKGLPFSERWVGKDLNTISKKMAFALLVKEGCLRPAPQLDDKEGCLISQAEATIYIDENNNIHIFSGG